MVNIGTPKSLTSNKCDSSITSKVNPGEVCTLEVAKQLGIDDPENYFTNDYSTIRTLNKDIDENDENRFDTLCYESTMKEKEEYYPHCILEHGPGYVRKQGSPDTCKTVECPPEFTFDPSKNACKKKTKDAIVLKTTQCSDRWNDWFTIPNYHLGNKYQKLDKKCYSPCDKSFVPSYTTDPTDELNSETNENPNYCMHKYNYLGGKYNNTADYCPISVIKNVGSTKRELKDEYEKMIEQNVTSSTEKEELFKNINNEINEISKNRENIITQNTTEPRGDELIACNNLNTPERIAETYSMCKDLYYNEDTIVEKFINDGDSRSKATLRVNSLKRACNSLYCSVNNNLTDVVAGSEWPPGSCKEGDENCKNILSGEPICFKDVKNIDLDKEAAKIRQEENKTYPEINSKKGQKSVKATFSTGITIIVLPIIIVTSYYAFKNFLIPKVIIPLYEKVLLKVWKYFYVYVIQNIIPSIKGKITLENYDSWVEYKKAVKDVNKTKSLIKYYNGILENIGSKIDKLNK